MMVGRKNWFSLFVNFCFLWGIIIQSVHSQDFILDDKKPLPIPNGFLKPSEAITEAAAEAAFIEGMKFYIIEEYSKALEIFEKRKFN